MISVLRRWLTAAAVLSAGAALAGAGVATGGAASAATASAAAKTAPGTDPTITIRVAGTRTAENGPPGPATATGLAGVTYRATSTGFTPVTCTSNAAGLCVLNVDASRTYTVTETGVPAGWYANPTLAAGTGGNNTSRTYDSLSVTVGTANVTIPAAAANSDTSPTARSGTWAVSADDPALPAGCGLRIALIIDLSSSITSGILPTYKAAATAFVDALKGTPSSVAIYTFGTTSPAPNTSGTNNANLVPPVSTATQAGVDQLVSKINGLTVPASQGTNWDNVLWRVAQDSLTYAYQSAFIVTDGDPTYYGPANNTGGRGNMTRFAEVENAVFSANALKTAGTPVISVGIGTATSGLSSVDNIRAISGPSANLDYFNTDFQQLSHVLAQLALTNCAGLDITKTAAQATYDHVGQEITYTYHVTNPKYFTLHGVHVLDDHIGSSVACTPSTLATGESATCTARYAITQADLDAGHVTNTAHASGLTPNSDTVDSGTAQATVTAHQTAAIHLVKSASPETYAAAGETIGYTYTVTNTGNVTLHGIALHDSRLGAVTCPYTALAPGDSMTCTGAHSVTQAEVDAGHIINTADVTGNPPTGPPVTGRDTATVTAVHHPAITLDKTAFPTQYSRPGERIVYRYYVTNTGNDTLHGITLHDNVLGPVTCPLTSLAPGQSVDCFTVHVTTQADVDRGHTVNTAAVTGHPPTGSPVTDRDGASVHAVHNPAIQLDKSASPSEFGAPGQTVTYTYPVTNTGNVTLHGIVLRDSRLGRITCPLTTLPPGGSMTCTGQHVTTQADVDKGDLENAAVVTGLSPAGRPVLDADTEAIPAEHTAHIDLLKSAFPAEYDTAGQKITYTDTVTNAGNVTLHNVTLVDDRLGHVTCLTDTLAPGESTTCVALYFVTQADVDAGHITNVAVDSGDPPTGPQVTDGDTETIVAVHAPAVQLQKAAFPTQYAVPGERITYTYTVVSTGNVTLHGVTLTDNRLGHVSCPDTALAPGQSMTCQAVKVTTKADVAEGQFSNVATVTGDPPSGPPVTDADTATVTAIRHPGIQVRKSASPAVYSAPGTAITYTYTVVNTGDATLHDLMLADSRLGPVSCADASLAAGQTTTCRAVYVTTPADVSNGEILNVATASGRAPDGTLLSGKAEAIVLAVALPIIPVTG
jgi:hypothetical protein